MFIMPSSRFTTYRDKPAPRLGNFEVFMLFKEWQCDGRWVRSVSSIAPYMFGVYLLHEHDCIRPLLWDNPVIVPNHYSLPVALHAILVALSLFLFCVAIDFLRAQLFCVLEQALDKRTKEQK